VVAAAGAGVVLVVDDAGAASGAGAVLVFDDAGAASGAGFVLVFDDAGAAAAGSMTSVQLVNCCLRPAKTTWSVEIDLQNGEVRPDQGTCIWSPALS